MKLWADAKETPLSLLFPRVADGVYGPGNHHASIRLYIRIMIQSQVEIPFTYKIRWIDYG